MKLTTTMSFIQRESMILELEHSLFGGMFK